MPNAALRAGDFSNARNTDGSLQIIYDPSTGNADGTGRVPFPNNQIPAGRINSITRQLLGWYPAPNTGGTGAGGLTGNYLATRKANDRSQELRRQGELEPDVGQPDLGQVQLSRRASSTTGPTS